MWPFRRSVQASDSADQIVEVTSVLADEILGGPAPPGDGEDLVDTPADEAARLLQAGEALRARRVLGKMVLGQVLPPALFDVALEGGCKFTLAGFDTPPVVTVPFGQALEIEGCVFEGDVCFAGLTFEQPVSIRGTRFHGDADLHACVFNRPLTLYRCHFEKRCGLGDSTFGDAAHFDRTHFVGLADFFNAVFEKGASFANARFDGEANFSRVRFVNPRSVFPCLDFRNCVAHEAAFFTDAQFEGICDFTASRFGRVAEFSGATFCLAAFTDAEFGRLNVRWEQVAGHKLLIGRMLFRGFDPSREIIREEDLVALLAQRERPPLAETHRQYDVLKAIFTRQGDHVSADECFYEWKQTERRESPLDWRPGTWLLKAFHYLNWIICGYGVKPIRAVFFGLNAVMLFAVGYLALDAASGQVAGGPWLSTLLGKVEFSFSTFMSIGASGAGLRVAVRVAFLCERMLGWLTLLLFFSTYTRIMLR